MLGADPLSFGGIHARTFALRLKYFGNQSNVWKHHAFIRELRAVVVIGGLEEAERA